MIFLTETKGKIRFIYIGFNCKRKKVGVKKCLEIMSIERGGQRLMEISILNIHEERLIRLRKKCLVKRSGTVWERLRKFRETKKDGEKKRNIKEQNWHRYNPDFARKK